ncbi:MAG: oligosaccharide flippase family protein [Candidatus Bathyarchaeia archaeon]
MSLSQKISTALTYNTLRVILSTISSILYSIVVVRWLQIQNFGGYAFLDSLFSILGVIYLLGSHPPVLRFIPEFVVKRDYCRLRTLISKLQIINLFGSLTATFLILISTDVFLTIFGKPELAFYARLMALGIIPAAVLGITKNMLIATYEQKFLSIFETFFSFLQLFLLIMFVLFLDMELTGVIITSLVNNIIAATIYSIYIRRKHPYLFKGEKIAINTGFSWRVIKYTLPLTALDLINKFTSYAGNIFLGAYRNLKELAYFDISNSFADRVFSQIWLLIGSLGIVSLSEASFDAAKFKLALQQYMKIILLYTLPVAMGGIIIAEPLLVILYGEKALPSVEIFRILLPAHCFLNIFGTASMILNVKEKTYLLLLGGAFRSLMIILLGLWLIPPLGINGTILSTILPSIIVTIYYTYFIIFKAKIGNFIPLRAMGKYFASSLFMGIIVVFLVHFLHTNRLWILFSSLIVGPLTYVLALRSIGAFDQTDKRIFMSMKVPFKSIILKLLWKD